MFRVGLFRCLIELEEICPDFQSKLLLNTLHTPTAKVLYFRP